MGAGLIEQSPRSVQGPSGPRWEWQEGLDRGDEIGDAGRPAQHVAPAKSGRGTLDGLRVAGSGQKHQSRVAVPTPELAEQGGRVVGGEDSLIHHNQAHRTAAGSLRAIVERRGQPGRAERVVARLPERRAEQSAGPLVRHDQEHPRRIRRHPSE